MKNTIHSEPRRTIYGKQIGTIAYFCKSYLPLSQTFIYDMLREIKQFHTIVLTYKSMNLPSFPYPNEKIFVKSGPLYQRYFYKILAENNVKLVHAHWGRYGIAISPLCRKLKLPLITSFHGIDVSRHTRHRFYRYKLRKLFEQQNGFIAGSYCMKKDLIKLGCRGEKVFVNYIGVDVEKFPYAEKKKNKDRIDILFIGRFIEKKGLEYAIRAFGKIANTYKHTFFTIIGDGEQKKNIELLIDSLALRNRVNLLGFKSHSEIPKIMQNMDIFLSPSVTAHNGDKEGIPTTIKEAMAMGLPVISTFHAGIPELVADGESGFLASERNINELANKLELLIRDHSLQEKFGKKGREIIVKQFNLTKQTQELEKIYHSFL